MLLPLLLLLPLLPAQYSIGVHNQCSDMHILYVEACQASGPRREGTINPSVDDAQI